MKNSFIIIRYSFILTALVIKFSENSEKELQKIITNYQEHEAYDSKEYPWDYSLKTIMKVKLNLHKTHIDQ